MAGGAAGSVLRYLLAVAMHSCRIGNLPWGTIVANAVGCFLLGLIAAIGERWSPFSKEVYLLLTVGLCGGFTTFSTFAADCITLSHIGHTLAAVACFAANVAIGFLLFALGRYLLLR